MSTVYTFCLSTYLLRDTWAASTFLLLWILLQWISVQSICSSLCFQFFWVYTQSGIAESYHTAFNFLNYCHTIFHSHHEYTSPNFSTFSSTLVFLNSQPNECKVGSHCVLIWIMMSSIFSLACWPSVYLFWRNVHSNTLPIFESSLLGFCCWLLGVLCID